MKKLIFLGLVVVMAACSSVMFTGRKQVKLIPGSEMSAMALQNYDQFLSENKISEDKQQTEMLNAVGQKMEKAVHKYMSENGYKKQLQQLSFEFNLVESEQINAWAMPGGKIVFYSGIMPVCENEAGVAVVMGHEIAHVLAQHGNERMSQQLMGQLGGMAFSEAIKSKPAETQAIYNTAFAIGAQYGALLPFSRLHEREADRIGQIIMAMAGYDPAYAVTFWERMHKMSGGASVPEFMSTHPSYDTRIQVLTSNIADAKKYMKQ